MLSSDEKRQLNQFSENVLGAVFYYTTFRDGSEKIEFINTHCAEIWGIEISELAGSPQLIWAMVHKDDINAVRASVQTAAETLSCWEQRWRSVGDNGKTKWLCQP